MASNYETGHSKNVANLEDIVLIITAYGQEYNPSNPKLHLGELQNLHKEAENSISAVNTAMPAYKNAVAERIKAFEGLSTKVTRLKNSLEVSGASDQSVAHAASLVKKVRGGSSTSKAKTEGEESESKSISTSQMSYDNRLSNYDQLVKFLATIPEYKPNEQELQIQTLEEEVKQLKSKNQAVMIAEIQLNNSRTARNKLLYDAEQGVYDRVADIKTYIKSVFGSSSPQYKQVSKIKFTKQQ